MVCERWCVTKMVCKRGCVKDGVWQSGVWKMVCQRWWVTKWCVKDGAWKMVGDKAGCERWCVKDGVWQSGVWKRVCQRWCHACHAKRRWMWDCATPATQNQRRCDQVPHLPRETKVDVTKCHACHANSRGVTGDKTGPKGATQCHKCHSCHAKRPWMWVCDTAATWNEGGCHQVPRLPRKAPRRLRRQIRAQARHPVP